MVMGWLWDGYGMAMGWLWDAWLWDNPFSLCLPPQNNNHAYCTSLFVYTFPLFSVCISGNSLLRNLYSEFLHRVNTVVPLLRDRP